MALLYNTLYCLSEKFSPALKGYCVGRAKRKIEHYHMFILISVKKDKVWDANRVHMLET